MILKMLYYLPIRIILSNIIIVIFINKINLQYKYNSLILLNLRIHKTAENLNNTRNIKVK